MGFVQIPQKTVMQRVFITTLAVCFFVISCTQVTSDTSTPILAEPEATSAATLTELSDPYEQEHQQLIEEIKAMGVQDREVLRAIASVPRHEFVLPEYLDQAYENHALPIGYGQTISQPYIVAWMTELLELQPGEKVLEIGTGSGYQAAVLADLGFVEIYSIEIVPELAELAAARLQDLGYTDIKVKQGDGYYGWPEYAPFDAILVTASPDHLPAPLVEQLSETGRLVIPIGPQGWVQTLWKFVLEEGELRGYNLGGVQFVPFTGLGIEEQQSEGTSIP
ncbi:MAG: protein-L-isoaspartate(D-aspartate) O-methyltransferase [Anaerolineales bacterium]|nr:protein-L-isoaspartate(D-aspartate) O-methyltransferase [Anaerolineales bacterium]